MAKGVLDQLFLTRSSLLLGRQEEGKNFSAAERWQPTEENGKDQDQQDEWVTCYARSLHRLG